MREVARGSLSREEALASFDVRLVAQAALTFELDPGASGVLRGVSAGPGAASGVAAFESGDVLALARIGVPSILVAYETSPEDIEAMRASRGVVTVSGGLTGHAGVVSRGLGKPCIASGGSSLGLRGDKLVVFTSPPRTWGFGDRFSFDGKTGEIVEGAAVLAGLGEDREEVLTWADKVSGARFVANVTTRVDATNAKRMGAQAIVLDGSDALFFGHERRVLADAVLRGEDDAKAALQDLLIRELEAMTEGFGAPPASVTELGHASNAGDALTAVLRAACDAVSIPLTERTARPSLLAEEIPAARLAAALEALATNRAREARSTD